MNDTNTKRPCCESTTHNIPFLERLSGGAYDYVHTTIEIIRFLSLLPSSYITQLK